MESIPPKTGKSFVVQTLQSNLDGVFFFFKVKPEHPFPAKQKKTVNVKVCTRYVSSAATNEKRKEDRVSKAL